MVKLGRITYCRYILTIMTCLPPEIRLLSTLCPLLVVCWTSNRGPPIMLVRLRLGVPRPPCIFPGSAGRRAVIITYLAIQWLDLACVIRMQGIKSSPPAQVGYPPGLLGRLLRLSLAIAAPSFIISSLFYWLLWCWDMHAIDNLRTNSFERQTYVPQSAPNMHKDSNAGRVRDREVVALETEGQGRK